MSRENPFGYNPNKVGKERNETVSGQAPVQEQGEKNIVEEEKARWAKFQQTTNAHIDKLVESGSCPAKWAEMKRESVATLVEVNVDPETLSKRASGQLPSSFFPNSDPEAYAIEFAEIGLPAIREFQEKTEETRKSALEKVQPLLDRVSRIITDLEDALRRVTNPSPSVGEKLKRLQEFQENLNEIVADFEAKVEEIRQLNFDIQDKIVAPDIEASMRELEEILRALDYETRK